MKLIIFRHNLTRYQGDMSLFFRLYCIAAVIIISKLGVNTGLRIIKRKFSSNYNINDLIVLRFCISNANLDTINKFWVC